MAQREYEQNEADAVAEKSDRHRETQYANRRQCLPNQHREPKIDCARNQSFQPGNQHRVARGYLPSQVVVDGPAETRDGDEHPSERRRALRARRPHQHDATSHDGEHPEHDATVEVLPEEKPSQQRRQHGFQIQQQRRRRRRARHQAIHQCYWTCDTAKEDGTRQPEPLATPRQTYRRLSRSPHTASSQDKRQSDDPTRRKAARPR